jgi:glutamate synthase domain-containing protein 3
MIFAGKSIAQGCIVQSGNYDAFTESKEEIIVGNNIYFPCA